MQRIIDGYRKRDRLTHQMLAEVAYAATYTMRNPEGKRPKDMFPILFETDSDEEEEQGDTGGISQEDYDRLQAEMRRINEEAERNKSKE